MNWWTGEDYPYSAKIDGYAVIGISDFFVVFGGQISVGASNQETDIVAQYKSRCFMISQPFLNCVQLESGLKLALYKRLVWDIA